MATKSTLNTFKMRNITNFLSDFNLFSKVLIITTTLFVAVTWSMLFFNIALNIANKL